MASPPSMSLDYWRGFFRGAGASIFDAIEAAILVAAADLPGDLRAHRDRIAERLYTALLPPPPQPPPPTARPGGGEREEGAASVPSLCSSDRAEAVTEETENDARVAAEAFRIKDILMNNQEKSEAVLIELLRRLQQLEFTVDTLKVTEIGKAVNGFRKHSSKQIRHLVRCLIESWKAIVDEWVNTTAAIVDHTPQSMHPSASGVEQEEGLPSPPLDERALFATPSTSIRLSESEFFDGMDDDGNIRNSSSKFDMQQEGGRRYPVNHEPARKQQQQPPSHHFDAEHKGHAWRQEPVMRQSRIQEPFNTQTRQQGFIGMQGRPSNAISGPGRPQKLPYEQKGSEMKPRPQQDISVAPRRPQLAPPDKSLSHPEENSVRAKLEIAKRKLQEGYQQAENAKRQRTIQVMDLQDIPKQGNQNWQSNAKPRNNIRNWSGGRH